jgi:hypothetical protein
MEDSQPAGWGSIVCSSTREPNAASEENRTMEDLADDAKQDLTAVIVTDEKPAILNPEDDAARTQECEYCGHYPCGCGG